MRWIAVLTVSIAVITVSVVMVFRAVAAQSSFKDHLGPFASSEPSGISAADIEEISTIIQQGGITVYDDFDVCGETHRTNGPGFACQSAANLFFAGKAERRLYAL